MIKQINAIATRIVALNNGGHTSTTAFIPINEPLHKQASIMNKMKLILDLCKGMSSIIYSYSCFKHKILL